jgi:hypothetical protein
VHVSRLVTDQVRTVAVDNPRPNRVLTMKAAEVALNDAIRAVADGTLQARLQTGPLPQFRAGGPNTFVALDGALGAITHGVGPANADAVARGLRMRSIPSRPTACAT